MEMEHCIKTDGGEIRSFLHHIKETVDMGWPDDMKGFAVAQKSAGCDARARRRRQRYIDYLPTRH